tara:strand:+ start:16769 stop:17050 length:282 start_codon:yes stop_codon:yes gene_type:complete
MNKEQLVQGIYNEYMGKRDQAAAELQVYLDNPVGVGEHGDIADVVKEKIERVAHLNGLTATMREVFMNGNQSENVESLNTDSVDLPSESLEQS